MIGDLGAYRAMFDDMLRSHPPELSYLARDWAEVEQWKAQARGKLHELLAFNPPRSPLDAQVERKFQHDGLEIEEISWNVGYGPRCRAWVLKPAGARGPLPAVLALHDHGGFKYYGKEKIAATDHAFPLTAEHRERSYGGKAWANELARSGFLVLVHDTFLFGSRGVDIADLPPRYQSRFAGLKPGSPELIRAYNTFAAEHEHVVAKSCFTAGVTWPGIYAYEDRRAVDYLQTRDDVKHDRIGCGGLSGGGLRTVMLTGTDPRIRASVCVGFMTTWQDFLHDRVWTHTWMTYIPHSARYLDFPDILTLNAPNPIMVQYDEEDPLYSLQGQKDADRHIRRVYEKMKAGHACRGVFYPGGHKFDGPMQDEAFRFWRQHLS